MQPLHAIAGGPMRGAGIRVCSCIGCCRRRCPCCCRAAGLKVPASRAPLQPITHIMGSKRLTPEGAPHSIQRGWRNNKQRRHLCERPAAGLTRTRRCLRALADGSNGWCKSCDCQAQDSSVLPARQSMCYGVADGEAAPLLCTSASSPISMGPIAPRISVCL